MSCAESEALYGLAPGFIVLMSLRPAIPWRVALLHCSPPLHQPFVMVNRVAGTVNHHLAGAGEFSAGFLGNFQPELTIVRPWQFQAAMFNRLGFWIRAHVLRSIGNGVTRPVSWLTNPPWYAITPCRNSRASMARACWASIELI